MPARGRRPRGVAVGGAQRRHSPARQGGRPRGPRHAGGRGDGERRGVLRVPPGGRDGPRPLVAAERFRGLYVDANAVAPATARAAGEIVGAAGAELVDGGIIGPPPREAGTTRLYLAGPRAGEVASLFKGTALEAIVMPGDVGTASALKMAYAAWTKGSSALLLAVRALAIREGVDGALRAEWERSQPGLDARSESAARRQRAEGLALRRRDGGDRRDLRRSRAAGRASTRRAPRSTTGSARTRTRQRRRRWPKWPMRSGVLSRAVSRSSACRARRRTRTSPCPRRPCRACSRPRARSPSRGA